MKRHIHHHYHHKTPPPSNSSGCLGAIIFLGIWIVFFRPSFGVIITIVILLILSSFLGSSN